MQRIHTLLQKITAVLKSPQPKSVIDLDLMLDYTRVLYADLLEWRAGVQQQPVAAPRPGEPTLDELTALMEQQLREAARPEALTPVSNVVQRATAAVPNGAEAPAAIPPPAFRAPSPATSTPPAAAPVAAIPVAAAPPPATAPTPPAQAAVAPPQPQPAGATPPPVAAAAEAPVPPAPVARPAEPAIPVSNLQREAPAAAAAQSVPPPPPRPFPVPHPEKAPDIRQRIGINDKYQFISELFGNDTGGYESAMTALSKLQSLKEAEDWMHENLWLAEQAEDSDALENFMRVLDAFYKR